MINFLNWLDGVLWGVPLIALIILTGIYFTVCSGFFQFRYFDWIMKRTIGQMFKTGESDAEGKGMLTSFEAISTAIGGTVGFGNIAGVATAVAAGGPGGCFLDVTFRTSWNDLEASGGYTWMLLSLYK